MTASRQTTLRGELRLNEPMARNCSWRVGGPVDRFYRPVDVEDLATFLAGLPENEGLFWLGLGTNILVRDGGIRGTVIATYGALQGLERLDMETIEVAAGVSCAKVARQCAQWNMRGAEFLAGIPGAMGGALAMNAGAFGGETWQHVAEVETIDRRGCRRWRKSEDFKIAYRSVKGPEGEWFIRARLRFAGAGSDDDAAQQIRHLLAKRAETQPIGSANCGSVFRNPPGMHAARLIESAGLKGHRIGGAVVSEKHANFIINEGSATAADIEALIEYVMDRVKQVYQVILQPEVRIVGERK